MPDSDSKPTWMAFHASHGGHSDHAVSQLMHGTHTLRITNKHRQPNGTDHAVPHAIITYS